MIDFVKANPSIKKTKILECKEDMFYIVIFKFNQPAWQASQGEGEGVERVSMEKKRACKEREEAFIPLYPLLTYFVH